MKHRLLVFGGNGFVGKSVVKAALASLKFDQVITVARTKANAVEHIVGNALDPSTYQNELVYSKDVTTHVVDLVSILIPNNGQTYEKSNYQSAAVIAETMGKAVKNSGNSEKASFLYMSAANSPPYPFPTEYIGTKRRAEAKVLETLEPVGVKVVLLRPGMIYSYNERVLALPAAFAAGIANWLKNRLLGSNFQLPGPIRFLFDKPTHVDECGKIVIESLFDENFTGVISPEDVVNKKA